VQGMAEWGENKYFKLNQFQRFINFKLLSQIKVNSPDGCDFLKFIVSVRSGRCDYFHSDSKRPSYSIVCNFYNVRYAGMLTFL
jgi:hypothetical protein